MDSTDFEDRADAGAALAAALDTYRGTPRLLVLGLPRGGVPVAAAVATALGAELDVVVVRKIGVPSQPELAMGAIAAVGNHLQTVRNDRVLERLPRRYGGRVFDETAARERTELRRRERAYRGDRGPPAVEGRTVIVVDDGLATGSSMRAALAALTGLGPAALAVAVPVGSADSCAAIASMVDDFVCLRTPGDFAAVGQAYRHFDQTSDAEVEALLR